MVWSSFHDFSMFFKRVTIEQAIKLADRMDCRIDGEGL